MFSMTHTLGWVVFYSSILIAVKYEMPFDYFLTILSAIMFSEMSPEKKNPTTVKLFSEIISNHCDSEQNINLLCIWYLK